MTVQAAASATGGQASVPPAHFPVATSDVDHVARLLHKAAYGLDHRTDDADHVLICALASVDFTIPNTVTERPVKLERAWVTNQVVGWTYDVLLNFGHNPQFVLAGNTYTFVVH